MAMAGYEMLAINTDLVLIVILLGYILPPGLVNLASGRLLIAEMSFATAKRKQTPC